jgi:hypothetical protein
MWCIMYCICIFECLYKQYWNVEMLMQLERATCVSMDLLTKSFFTDDGTRLIEYFVANSPLIFLFLEMRQRGCFGSRVYMNLL